jgi:ABC-2 type transport system ATP-binding protein
MIKAEGLTKYYGGFRAVDNITFSIGSGEIVGLLGPNGAGKTTTMRLLTGYMPPTAGSISIGDYNLLEKPLHAKKLIGYLPENPPLYPEMTVREYLHFAAALHSVSRDKRKDYVDEAIERTSLEDVPRRLIGNLSRGYQQRVGLAKVLVKKPKVLILDEPTIGLDPKQIAEIRNLIKDLAGDYTVILSSHILQEVSATCERVIIIHQGHIVAQDSHENLVQHRQDREVFRVKLKGISFTEAQAAFQELAGVLQVSRQGSDSLTDLRVVTKNGGGFQEQLFTVLKEKNWVPYELVPEHSTLEDIFLRLTEES